MSQKFKLVQDRDNDGWLASIRRHLMVFLVIVLVPIVALLVLGSIGIVDAARDRAITEEHRASIAATRAAQPTPLPPVIVLYKIHVTEGNPFSENGCTQFDVVYRLRLNTFRDHLIACQGDTTIRQYTAQRGDLVSLSVQHKGRQSDPVRFSCITEAAGNRIASVESSGGQTTAECAATVP